MSEFVSHGVKSIRGGGGLERKINQLEKVNLVFRPTPFDKRRKIYVSRGGRERETFFIVTLL